MVFYNISIYLNILNKNYNNLKFTLDFCQQITFNVHGILVI